MSFPTKWGFILGSLRAQLQHVAQKVFFTRGSWMLRTDREPPGVRGSS